jgi:hypothetical protein
MNWKIALDILRDRVAPLCKLDELSPKRLGKIVGELAKFHGMTVQVVDAMTHRSDVAHGCRTEETRPRMYTGSSQLFGHEYDLTWLAAGAPGRSKTALPPTSDRNPRLASNSALSGGTAIEVTAELFSQPLAERGVVAARLQFIQPDLELARAQSVELVREFSRRNRGERDERFRYPRPDACRLECGGDFRHSR